MIYFIHLLQKKSIRYYFMLGTIIEFYRLVGVNDSSNLFHKLMLVTFIVTNLVVTIKSMKDILPQDLYIRKIT